MESLKSFLITRLLIVVGAVWAFEAVLLIPIRQILLPLAAYFGQMKPAADNLTAADIARLLYSVFSRNGESAVLGLLARSQVFLLLLAAAVLVLAPIAAGVLIYSRLVAMRVNEIAARRDAERMAYEARRNLMISDFAHDLRTPITTIAGYAGALADGMVTEPEQKKEYLEAIRRKSVRMTELINLLFDYVRLGSADFHLQKKDWDINALAAEVAASLYTDAEDAGMELGADIPEEPFIVCADRGQVSRILHNLCTIDTVEKTESTYRIYSGEKSFEGYKCVISAGRSGSKWMEKVCRDLGINTKSNRVDLGVRVELPAEIFSHLTDELYESKIVYRTEKYEDTVRTFCMNPKGAVVTENTNGIVTVNGHSYEDPARQTNNTNFALLVAKHFSEPFKDSNEYGESIARLSNMLGGGVMVQRFGDLIRGKRSTEKRIRESFTVPTLNAAAGDLSLVLPKRILDGIIEMIYALDKVAPGTANDDTLLYGVEVKFYNMEVEVDNNLMTCHKDIYVIGDGSGITHSLSHASASGVYVARQISRDSSL